jgi:hypothetical protein
MPLGIATAAIVIAASTPSTVPGRMELIRYENEKVTLYYRRCSENEGRLAVYEVPNKKTTKGCWYSELGTVQIIWDSGKSNVFELNEFTFFSKEIPGTVKQIGGY